jgi:hypothetical protein
MMRGCAWAPGTYTKSADPQSDWDSVTKSYPARIRGVCRHKAAWLQQVLGGSVIYGRRTDEPKPGMHAVLWINISGREYVVDRDGIWPAETAPFACDGNHKAYRREEPPPPERTMPRPWYEYER